MLLEIARLASAVDGVAVMGGRGSGVTAKRKHKLPRKYSEGALARLDRRYREPKMLFAAIEQMKADHGDEPLSFVKLRVIQRTAHLDALLIAQEARLAKGDSIDVSQYLANAQVFLRFASTIGLERRARTVRSLRDVLLEEERRLQPPTNGAQEPAP